MTKVAVLIETTDNEVKAANFGVLTAAHGDGHEICAFLTGADAEGCKAVLGKYGVGTIISIEGDGADLQAKPDLKAKAIIAAMKEYETSVLLALSSSEGRDILARVAASLKVPLATDCLSVDISSSTVRKPYFSGKTIATLKMNGAYFLSAIRPNAVEPAEAPAEAAVISFTAVVGDYDGLVVKEIKQSSSGKVDLSEANVIVSGGRPIGSEENFKILEECADAMGGAVGASRVSVDEGYAPHSIQVGQTGKIVNPRLYIACGISGSVQHFAGMKTSKVIVAINSDKDAPIFNKCDYGIVGDIFEVVSALTAELAK